MSDTLISDKTILDSLGIKCEHVHRNLSPEQLISATVSAGEGTIVDSGALLIKTGKFTGRSPKDRYIVRDTITTGTVDWNDINRPISAEQYGLLRQVVVDHLSKQEQLYVQDARAGADSSYSLSVRVVAEKPWSAQFASNMFLRLEESELAHFAPEWTVLCAPTCTVDPQLYDVRASNFVLVSFEEKTVLIAGTGYTGEIKKSIFSVLNYLLPTKHGVLPMHCSANVGRDGDTAIFFGLSGTGKTTLSTDPNRRLVGDDEHGWSDQGVFNFEGGCYAKCIGLDADKEPEIYNAIRPGAILENMSLIEGTLTPDFADDTITQNTRVSYPIFHIDNIQSGSKAGQPEHIFFLTCDAFGVLPPVSRLTKDQAMYHFISGYTAKVAGTETGVTEPTATFSACFGAPFMPLHPGQYADMLGAKMEENNTKIWLVNTGWTGGASPAGSRISLKYTRAIIQAALSGELVDVGYETLAGFDLSYPTSCPGVPSELLNPKNAWSDPAAYDRKAEQLAELFVANFEQYAGGVRSQVVAAAPKSLHLAY